MKENISKKPGLSTPLNRAEDLVEHILGEYPETRSSDTLLFFKCLEIQGIAFPHEIIRRAIRDGISPETCRRTRQHLQNTLGKYLPEKEVREGRLLAEGEWRQKWQ